MKLMQLSYVKFRFTDGSEIVYVVDGNKIYYCGVKGKTHPLAIIKEIVEAICKIEKTNWHNTTFYEVICRTAGYNLKPEEFNIVKITTSKETKEFDIVGYFSVLGSGNPPPEEYRVHEEINPKVLALFMPFIGIPQPR